MLGLLVQSLTRIAVMIMIAKTHLGPRSTDAMGKSHRMARSEELDDREPDSFKVIDALTACQKRDRRIMYAVLAIWFVASTTGSGPFVEGGI